MKTVAFINQKGGVGKTTTAINTATELANRGAKTLFIDLDAQGNGTKVMGAGKPPKSFPVQMADILRAGHKPKLAEAINPSDDIKNLFYVPASISLSRAITETVCYRKEDILASQLEKIADQNFEYVVLDCAPDLALTSIHAIVVADLIVVPINGGQWALDGMEDLILAIKEIRGESFRDFFTFRNDFAIKNKLINELLEEELDDMIESGQLSPCSRSAVKIRKTEQIGQANAVNEVLAQYRPKSEALGDYKALVDEVLERLK